MSKSSVWRGTASDDRWPQLSGDKKADVVIIGAGITGVTAAFLLARQGRSVVLLEARQVGGGDTGGSTGNLYATVSRGLHGVSRKWGDEVTRAVVRSRREAISFVEATTR